MTTQASKVTQWQEEYKKRIDWLHLEAQYEGIEPDESSESDFWRLMNSLSTAPAADVTISQEGHLRAVWEGPGRSHIAIRFIGNSEVVYVMWRRLPESKDIKRTSGNIALNEIKKRVAQFGLASLWGIVIKTAPDR